MLLALLDIRTSIEQIPSNGGKKLRTVKNVLSGSEIPAADEIQFDSVRDITAAIQRTAAVIKNMVAKRLLVIVFPPF